MANRRMVPTRFFKDPDIMNLSSKDVQLILLGLILAADDEGREVAHAGLLGREMDYPAESIEAALLDIEKNDLLVLYQSGKHRYYQLTRWDQWQTLGNKKTPSKHPAPPTSGGPDTQETRQHLQKISEVSQKNSGKNREIREFPGKTSTQLNLIESKRIEDDRQPSVGTSELSPSNIVPFPGGNDSNIGPHVVQQIAQILCLPITDGLNRLLTEYEGIPGLSLAVEADAAREWIQDTICNKRNKRMSLAFFRNWLKREKSQLEERQAQLQNMLATQTTGTAGGLPSSRTLPVEANRRSPSLMHLAEQDEQIKTKGAPR